MLVDAGPLVAIIDDRDRRHQDCVAALGRIPGPLLTLLPPFTEAMYLSGRARGWPRQEMLWRLLDSGQLSVASLERGDLARARDLMRQYRDTPMDFADATLVAYAERENLREIFTLDRRGFSTYRLGGRSRFIILP